MIQKLWKSVGVLLVLTASLYCVGVVLLAFTGNFWLGQAECMSDYREVGDADAIAGILGCVAGAIAGAVGIPLVLFFFGSRMIRWGNITRKSIDS